MVNKYLQKFRSVDLNLKDRKLPSFASQGKWNKKTHSKLVTIARKWVEKERITPEVNFFNLYSIRVWTFALCTLWVEVFVVVVCGQKYTIISRHVTKSAPISAVFSLLSFEQPHSNSSDRNDLILERGNESVWSISLVANWLNACSELLVLKPRHVSWLWAFLMCLSFFFLSFTLRLLVGVVSEFVALLADLFS